MNTGLKWIKDTNSYNAHTDKLVDIVGSTNSTVCSSRFKSINKNLWREWKEITDGYIDGESNMIAASATRKSYYIPIEPNTAYSIIKPIIDPNNRFYVATTSEIPKAGVPCKILLVDSSVTTGTVVTPSDAKYLVTHPVLINSEVKDLYERLKTIQVERGNISTSYESPQTNYAYVIAKDPVTGKIVELRSLPNGTKDEVRVSGGKAEWIKRTKKIVIGENDITTSINLANVYRVRVAKPDDCVNFVDAIQGCLTIQGMIEKHSVSDATVTSEFFNNFATDVSQYIFFYFSPGTTLAQAQTALAGKELTYQLANDVVTPIQTSGNLISYPSGTVYVENVVADAGNYTTKFDIKELQLPIKSIDKLIKYNFTTGVQTVLDTSLAVINADKKSFTHPNLAKDDMVFVDYFYDVESTLGETTIEYLDSRHTIKDSVNNKFYKWDIKSANGVPTVSLTEVL